MFVLPNAVPKAGVDAGFPNALFPNTLIFFQKSMGIDEVQRRPIPGGLGYGECGNLLSGIGSKTRRMTRD